MRKAYIGLSTPIGYNYRFETKENKPNAILDSPLGLFLFYDEIWFFDRSLCPLNCQDLKYTYFLNEEYNLEKSDLFDYSEELRKLQIEQHDIFSSENQLSWEEVLKINLGYVEEPIDNHGRGVEMGNLYFSLNSTPYNLNIDKFIAEKYGLELITSTITNQMMKDDNRFNIAADLTQIMLVENIPNFQLLEGPYHPFLEELRKEELISYFRNKITDITLGKDFKDITKLKEDLNKQMDVYKDELVLKALSKTRVYKSALDAVTGQIPLLSNIYSIGDSLNNLNSFVNERKINGWAGFIVQGRQIINNSKK